MFQRHVVPGDRQAPNTKPGTVDQSEHLHSGDLLDTCCYWFVTSFLAVVTGLLFLAHLLALNFLLSWDGFWQNKWSEILTVL